ncbi:hypothetical protein CRUP_011374 [Coryphaenoides rupestris]|nr:hypothetical protein CRUP_011374 [Coryphaenoides rupestris]
MLAAEYVTVGGHGRPRGVVVCRHLSKYAPIFLLLALFGLIFLLRNIHTLENSLHTAFAQEDPPPLYHNHTFCSRLGMEPSADEALEESYLLKSIAWPPPPARPAPAPLRQTSDPVHSLFAILPFKGQREWHVGDQLEALVQMHDFQGRPKRYGGDFLLARLHSPELGAGVAGRMVDHLNGFYSALFPLPWEGEARVEVTMVHSSEAVAVLQRLQDQRPDRVYFKSLFRSGFLSETTVCNMCLPAPPQQQQQQQLCNFTDLHTGEPWYCLKPKLLGCDSRINHAKGGYQKHLITNKEAQLFQSKVNIKLENSSIKTEPAPYVPSGFYYRGSWCSPGGAPGRQFNDSASVAQCLAGKVLHMYGDSTVRQWFEYLKAINVGPYMAVDSKHNILLKYRCHGPPIRFSTVSASELRYVANELDGLPGGPDTVVLISIWAHFSTFPVDVYIRRMRHIRRALVRLMDRGPGTLAVIRTPNLQALDPEVSLYNSDWFAHQLDRVLRPMFSGLGVVFVDAWEMTLAHHLPHDLHPAPAIIKNMVDRILSHVCPAKKKNKKS